MKKSLDSVAAGFTVRSAGTIAQDDVAMDRSAADQLIRLGGDPAGHRSRYLTSSMIASADLILTGERSHRAAVASLVPRASRRSFTMKEFARVLQSLESSDLVDVHTVQELISRVSRLRGAVSPPAQPQDDDLDDPYRRSESTHRRVADEIEAAILVAADALRLRV